MGGDFGVGHGDGVGGVEGGEGSGGDGLPVDVGVEDGVEGFADFDGDGVGLGGLVGPAGGGFVKIGGCGGGEQAVGDGPGEECGIIRDLLLWDVAGVPEGGVGEVERQPGLAEVGCYLQIAHWQLEV